ncbi:MAG: hypothetical protein IJT49_02635 [Clostridia bacterium]|nr:hypothetical protein [Clostridia bacterium]
MTLSEKTAYLKGLADGMKISTDSDQGKLLHEIINVLEDVSDSIGALEDECDRLNEYVEELDEDLGDVEDYLFDDEDDYEDEDDEDDEDDDFDDEDYDDDVIEIECPNCGETICVPPTVDYAHLICPACNEEFSYIEEDEGPTDED